MIHTTSMNEKFIQLQVLKLRRIAL